MELRLQSFPIKSGVGSSNLASSTKQAKRLSQKHNWSQAPNEQKGSHKHTHMERKERRRNASSYQLGLEYNTSKGLSRNHIWPQVPNEQKASHKKRTHGRKKAPTNLASSTEQAKSLSQKTHTWEEKSSYQLGLKYRTSKKPLTKTHLVSSTKRAKKLSPKHNLASSTRQAKKLSQEDTHMGWGGRRRIERAKKKRPLNNMHTDRSGWEAGEERGIIIHISKVTLHTHWGYPRRRRIGLPPHHAPETKRVKDST